MIPFRKISPFKLEAEHRLLVWLLQLKKNSELLGLKEELAKVEIKLARLMKRLEHVSVPADVVSDGIFGAYANQRVLALDRAATKFLDYAPDFSGGEEPDVEADVLVEMDKINAELSA